MLSSFLGSEFQSLLKAPDAGKKRHNFQIRSREPAPAKLIIADVLPNRIENTSRKLEKRRIAPPFASPTLPHCIRKKFPLLAHALKGKQRSSKCTAAVCNVKSKLTSIIPRSGEAYIQACLTSIVPRSGEACIYRRAVYVLPII